MKFFYFLSGLDGGSVGHWTGQSVLVSVDRVVWSVIGDLRINKNMRVIFIQPLLMLNKGSGRGEIYTNPYYLP